MSCISFGRFKTKIYYPIISIILLYIIFNLEYFSGYLYDYKRIKSPNFYCLFFSFSFLGSCFLGGICLFILKHNLRADFKELKALKQNNQINNKDNKDNKENQDNKDNKEKKDNENRRVSLNIPLLYDAKGNKIDIPFKYFIYAAFLELLTNFSFCSIVFDFMDIESKILYGGFEIIFIKIIGKIFFKNNLYRHQIISMIILLIILISVIMFRENFLLKIVHKDLNFYKNKFENYLIETSNAKLESGIIYYYYFVFIIVGLLSKSLSVCYEKWLITDKLCDPYKLLYFKGLIGFIPALLIQLSLYFTIGESGNITEEKINIRNVYKRLSFTISSFTNNIIINTVLIIIFFILVASYNITITNTIHKFKPEFVGFVSIFSSSLSMTTIQFVISIINGNGNNKNKKLICFIHLLFFSLLLIPSLIICEIIILHFCNCDKNIYYNIEKRANSDIKAALYSEDDEENKTSALESEDQFSRSQEDNF